MALALLKFPEAPDSFRKSILHTLKEEQNHTRWYIQRMQECGIQFGDLPVSPMIWKHIADMESPLDYVSRLSLTFEQANLDYAHYYSKVLHNLGDTKSAKILHTVYQDEIAHVGLGIKWLRRWKEKSQTDWDAWHKQLHFPLSPIRAKGVTPFNEEARSKAGLSEDFIASLKRYQSSRGRSPDLCYFNPFAEIEFSQPGWTCPRKLHELAADLEPAFALSAPSQDDIILMRRLPDDAQRDRLARFGLTFPEVLPLSEIAAVKKNRKLRFIRPWAQLSPLLSKSATLKLRDLLPEHLVAIPSQLCQDETSDFIALHPFENWVAKELHGAAGRGIHRFTKETVDQLPKKPLLIEPWLEKIHEISFLFQRNPAHEGGLRSIGIVHQETSRDGQWLSSESRAKPSQGLIPELACLLNQVVFPSVKEDLMPALEALLSEDDYHGPLCIDSFFYRDPDGSVKWQPVVEVNARWTMGRIAHQLRLKVAPNRSLKLTTCSPLEAKELSPPEPDGSHFRSGAIALGVPSASSSRVPVVLLN
jgi:hypothetical protein